MKLWKIMLIVSGITAIILAFFMIVPVIVMDKSWRWFFGPLIFFGIAYIIAGLVILIIKIITKKKPAEQKINIKDAKLRAVYEMKYDDDNPDNFKIDETSLLKIGEKGAEKTPVLVLEGIGTEMNQRRVIIINLNDPKKESSSLIDPDDAKIDYKAKIIADHPPEEIMEKIVSGVDELGRPTITKTVRKPSSVEEKKKNEEEAAEAANAV